MCIRDRDRSWGVRPVGAYDSQPPVPMSLPQFYWLWNPAHFDDFTTQFHFVDDSEGNIIEEKKIQVSEEEIIEMTETFVGESKQKAPFFSALKYKGKPLYKYAREGRLIEKEPRNIKVYNLSLIHI